MHSIKIEMINGRKEMFTQSEQQRYKDNATLDKIIYKYYDKSVREMTTRDALNAFDSVYESIMDDCLDYDIEANYELCFYLWLTGFVDDTN
jgi:hypothetical protein